MVNLRIKLAGIGGQGIQFMGKLLGEAAFKQGLNVSQGVKYEPSTKGGLTVADIVIAPPNEEIIYPFIEREPDVLVVLAQRAWDEYKDITTERTVLLADKDNVQEFRPRKYRLILHYPFVRKALEIGSENIANVIILGFLSDLLDVGEHFLPKMLKAIHPDEFLEPELLEVDPDKFEDSIVHASPSRFREMNLKAFRLGLSLSRKLDYSSMVMS